MKFMIIALFIAVISVSIVMLVSGKTRLKEGDKAPKFSLYDDTGTLKSLDDFAGKKIVLYFYPKDNTPGCTKEACSLRDSYSIFSKNNVAIIGISYDSVEKHKKFKEQHHLPFPLLSDPSKEVAKKYGASYKWLFFTAPIPRRMTFIIDGQGNITKILRNVDVTTHTEKIVSILGIK